MQLHSKFGLLALLCISLKRLERSLRHYYIHYGDMWRGLKEIRSSRFRDIQKGLKGHSLVNTNLGEKLVIFEALFKMFLKLAGYIYWRLISGLSSVSKYLSSGFLTNAKFVGMDEITCENCNKSSYVGWKNSSNSRSPVATPPSFCTHFSMESNHYEMKLRFQSLSFS